MANESEKVHLKGPAPTSFVTEFRPIFLCFHCWSFRNFLMHLSMTMKNLTMLFLLQFRPFCQAGPSYDTTPPFRSTSTRKRGCYWAQPWISWRWRNRASWISMVFWWWWWQIENLDQKPDWPPLTILIFPCHSHFVILFPSITTNDSNNLTSSLHISSLKRIVLKVPPTS